MELAPGFRGYGKDMTKHHPTTKIREDMVETIKEKLNLDGKDRFEIQDALLPFRDKLPKKYQGKNERLGERL